MVWQRLACSEKNTPEQRVRKWLKYRTAELWTRYKWERNWYNTMIKFNKRHTITMMINEDKNDIRNLYKVVCTLTGQDSKNPLLKAKSGTELAEEFADFFLLKINMIRQQFDKIEAYQPTGGDVPELQMFSMINEHGLRHTIMKMPSKSIWNILPHISSPSSQIGTNKRTKWTFGSANRYLDYITVEEGCW